MPPVATLTHEIGAGPLNVTGSFPLVVAGLGGTRKQGWAKTTAAGAASARHCDGDQRSRPSKVRRGRS